MRLILSVYEIRIEVRADQLDSLRVLENLGRDFDYFRVEALEGDPQITLEIRNTDFDSGSTPIGPKIFKTKLCDVYGWGSRRFCDYGQGVWIKSINSPGHRSFTVYGKQMDLVYEAAYLALLSSLGEELDRKGYHRLHAVAFQINGISAAVAADSGLGKSATAALLIQSTPAKIFSDEMPLICGGKIYPFPIRMALHTHVANSLGIKLTSERVFKRKIYPTKALIEIKQTSVAQISSLDHLFLGVLGKAPLARPTSFFEQIRFIVTYVMGIGLPQMSEHMLRSNNLLMLVKIAFSRFRTALSLLGWTNKKIQAQTLVLSPDPRAHVQTLLKNLSLKKPLSSETTLSAP